MKLLHACLSAGNVRQRRFHHGGGHVKLVQIPGKVQNAVCPVPSRLLKSGIDVRMRHFFLQLGGVKEICNDDTALALNMEDALMIKKSLRISDIVQILENANKYDHISAPPSKPKTSQVFLYKTDDAAKEGNIIIIFRPLLKNAVSIIILLKQKQHQSYINSRAIFFQ